MEDYRRTLNLLNTPFPMKADLPRREPDMLSFWEKMGLYRRFLERNQGRPTFILHDGPPYSNGHIHLGTALNKVLKDIVVKFKGMTGWMTPMVPGWDNHGMPIENEIIREFREKKMPLERFAVRKRCREFAAEWVGVQRSEFKRLGAIGEWENPYLTMSAEYESKILETFAELVDRGYIYRSPRPVHWCITCRTSLANIEIEYKDKTSYSLWIRFPLVDDPRSLFVGLPKARVFAMVWTTTPWTIPGNLAITAHPGFAYVVVKEGNDYYLLGQDLLEAVRQELGLVEAKVIKQLAGKDLDGLVFRHPIFDRASKILLGNFVTGDTGTGLVHTAPGHGHDDFEIGRANKLPVLCPVDEGGHFTNEAGEFAGLSLEAGDQAVMDALKREGNLLKRATVEHSYPFCWRCHNPLVFRTTLQWYMNIDYEGHRRKELEAIEKLKWYPARSLDRIRGFITTQPDWCLSRQRFWGVGIPAFYCRKCGEAMLSGDVIRRVARMVKEHHADVWYDDEKMSGLTQGLQCSKCGGTELVREKDILDVWFDSACSNLVVLEGRPDHHWPAELYLEGSDQHRGWFSLSMTVAMGARQAPPYRGVVTHGFVVDKNGLAMHKSLGNFIAPSEVTDKFGADVLRLWAVSSEYYDDVRVGDEIMDRVVEAYRKIRNTLRFLLANTSDFDYAKDRVGDEEIRFVDRYIRSRLQRTIAQVRTHYENFEFHKVYHLLYNFCVVDLSSMYFDILKDRLYTWPPRSPGRRAAQTVLAELVEALVMMLAPILSFTTEEAYQLMPGRKQESVFLNDMPSSKADRQDDVLEKDIEELLSVREFVLKRLEVERQAKTIGSGLEARVLIVALSETTRDLVAKYMSELPAFFIVSQVEITSRDALGPAAIFDEKLRLGVDCRTALGSKCRRCWIYSPDVGQTKAHPELCGKCVSALEV